MSRLSDTDEVSLVSALRSGSQEAFEQLYHSYKSRVYYNTYRLVMRAEIAEELTQEVFLKIWLLRETIDPGRSFPAFLFRISGNMVMDFYRKAASDKKLRETLIRSASEQDEPAERQEWAVQKDVIHDAIKKLPQRRREVFELCKIEGKTYTEVAGMLGISQGTINDHIVKATRFLREELKDIPGFWYLIIYWYLF